MYDPKNIKHFKPCKAVKKRWAEMEDGNDHAGLCVDKMALIVDALRKCGSERFAKEASALMRKANRIARKRMTKGGITCEEASAAYTYYRMALAIAKQFGGSTAEVEIDG